MSECLNCVTFITEIWLLQKIRSLSVITTGESIFYLWELSCLPDETIRRNAAAMYLIDGLIYRYSKAVIKVNTDPIRVGSTAPNVKVIPITKPSKHSAL